ncbi:MAG: amidohydrolase, partial [Clostridia bacterium]|nr:amidohydrolase [Clostridia bacterium]
TWHPADVNEVVTGSCLACIQTEYIFSGQAAHAAGCPELGRSALDAAELCNIGVQFLREHMPPSARIHYAFTDGGGLSPNVVQPTARVLYMVRDERVKSALELQKRVDDVAAGAALMTGTQLKKRFIDGCSELLPNYALEDILYKNFSKTPLPVYTDEDWALARALHASYREQVAGQPVSRVPDEAIQAEVRRLSEDGGRALNDFLMPLYHGALHEPGSTDVGDVSWLTPTAQVHALTYPSLCPGHSWQNVAAGKSRIAHEGMLLAARVLAGAAVDLIEQPALLDAVRAEFSRRSAAGWQSPIPDGAVPELV